MEEKFDWKLKAKLKAQKAKAAIKEKSDKVKNFIYENPKLSLTIAMVGIPAVSKAVKSASRAVEASIEERHRQLETYDRRTDTYLELKRPLKPREQEILALRMEAGESKTMILRDLGLLK